MSPASYQAAPPRVAFHTVYPSTRLPVWSLESGKRDSNPRPQPWQGCALPTELFPRRGAAGATPRLQSAVAITQAGCDSGGEGNRTPDLLNAIQALSQLSYAPGSDSRTPCHAGFQEPRSVLGGNENVNKFDLAKIRRASILQRLFRTSSVRRATADLPLRVCTMGTRHSRRLDAFTDG